MKPLYYILLLLNNSIACLFFGIAFLNSPAMSDEAPNPLTEQQLVVRLILYGIIISLVFSLISLLLGRIFRTKMSFERKDLKRLFVFDFFILLIIWLGICVFMYFK